MQKELQNHHKEERPWGKFEKFTQNELSTVKIITVNPHQAFSLQHHKTREEFWKIISGEGIVTIGDKKWPVKAGEEIFIPKETNHRLEASEVPLVFLEISFGVFDEDDIVRTEDRYGRV